MKSRKTRAFRGHSRSPRLLRFEAETWLATAGWNQLACVQIRFAHDMSALVPTCKHKHGFPRRRTQAGEAGHPHCWVLGEPGLNQAALRPNANVVYHQTRADLASIGTEKAAARDFGYAQGRSPPPAVQGSPYAYQDLAVAAVSLSLTT